MTPTLPTIIDQLRIMFPTWSETALEIAANSPLVKLALG